MIIGGRDFNDGHTHVMGILNVTPDSISDGENITILTQLYYTRRK